MVNFNFEWLLSWVFVVVVVVGECAGLPAFVIGGIGASLAILVAVIAHFSLSRRG